MEWAGRAVDGGWPWERAERLTGRANSTAAIPGDDGASEGQVARTTYSVYFKRVCDLILSWSALLCCLPVLLALTVAVILDSPGSAIYRQARVGAGGRRFDILKLRTMYVGADNEGFTTSESDQRITRFGRFLRDTKLDELPQLWNIVRGDMSVIGPRPLSVEECEYLATHGGFHPGHPGFYPLVRPGLTGLEQIYRIHPLSYEDRFAWNDLYESQMSAWQDLRIFVTTAAQCKLVCLATALGGIGELALIGLLISRTLGRH